MFLGAAIRSYAERRDGRARLRLLPQVGRLRRKLDPHKWLFVGGGLLLFLALLGALLTSRHGATDRTAPLPAATASRPAPRPTAARSDPVLSAARAARAAGRYEAPPGRNALDLYKAVLLARGDHPEARAGLAAITALVTERARAAAAAGNEAEARRLARRVLDADPGHAGARQLLARLEARPAPSPPPVAASGPDATPTTTPPATAAARDARASAEAPAATGIVRPDPLTPRIVGHAATVRAAASRGGRSRSFGAPIDSGHAIAGFAAPATATAAIRPDDPAVDSGSAVAGVESRDLTTLATPAPEYPAQALRAHVEGWVEVEFTVDERGATADILVAGSEPAGVFDAAATTAVAGWRYLPRVVNGRTVPQRTSVTLRFSVED